MEEWIESLFAKTGKPLEFKPAFRQIFQSIFDGIKTDFGVDPFVNQDALLEEDDPEMGTLHDIVEEDCARFFDVYLAALDEKHSPEFTLQVAIHMRGSGGEMDDAKSAAFEHIRNSLKTDMTNPAYAEAFNTCLRQGKSEHFAWWCAENIIDARPSWERVYQSAAEYDRLIQSQLKRGYPIDVAKEYAFQVSDNTSEEFAQLYADKYSAQLALGKTDEYAREYAKQYTQRFEQSGSWDEDDSDNFLIELETDGYMKGKEKGHDPEPYSSHFTNAYFAKAGPKGETHEQAMSRAEQTADAEMERRKQGLPRPQKSLNRRSNHRTLTLRSCFDCSEKPRTSSATQSSRMMMSLKRSTR